MRTLHIGQIDKLASFDCFRSDTSALKHLQSVGLKPGQYVELCRPKNGASSLRIYIQEHKPCSATAFATFVSCSTKHGSPSEKQLALMSEIFGEKLDKSKYQILPESRPLGGRSGIMISWKRSQKANSKVLNQAFYLVADDKNRIIEEFGYDVGTNDKYPIPETLQTLNNVKFIKEAKQ